MSKYFKNILKMYNINNCLFVLSHIMPRKLKFHLLYFIYTIWCIVCTLCTVSSINISPLNLCIRNRFSDFNFCFHHLNISRKAMPQLVGIQAEKFEQYLFDNRIHFDSWCTVLSFTASRDRYHNIQQISSTQNEIHKYLTLKLVKILQKEEQRNVVYMSTDGHILDGHHRFAAAAILGKNLKVMIIDIPIEKLLNLALQFSTEIHY